MNEAELRDLAQRCVYASVNGFQVAKAELYAQELAELGAEMPEGEITAAALANMAKEVLAGAKPKAKSAPKVEPKVEPKSEPKAEPKAAKASKAKASAKPALEDEAKADDDLAVLKEEPTGEKD